MKKITYLLAILVSMISGLQCSSENIEGHDYVDLGLPSGIKWATCNVGTNKPTKLGNYFAWAEVNKTEGFVIADNKYLKVGSNTRYSKYVIIQEGDPTLTI
ncbi:MAG: hypothetical protein J6Y37_08170 [Paludibacteraceae bacterium]|nr:hypothetical protein [Paludibacteraceae bacterium]